MFDKLVDVLLQFLSLFRPFTTLTDYERGVVLRFGKFHRQVGPGFHWLWPLHIEELLWTNHVPETLNVVPQSLTTRDGQSIIISVVVTFGIADAKAFLLEIEGANQVIEDSTYGIVSGIVTAKTWDELRAMDLAGELTKVVRRQAKRYGVRVDQVAIQDFTRSRSFRLISSSKQL